MKTTDHGATPRRSQEAGSIDRDQRPHAAPKPTARQVARLLWEADGKPDGRGLGEANRGTYQRAAESVFEAIRTLGFKVVRCET